MTGRRHSTRSIQQAVIQALEPRLFLAAQLVAEINTARLPSDPQNLVDVNGTLYFSADDGSAGRELWKSDGTVAGTVLVKDIRPGADEYGNRAGSDSRDLTNVSGTLYFTADDGANGRELWAFVEAGS